MFVFLSLFLISCATEQEENLTGTFMLKAESGYNAPENEEDAAVYIIDTYTNEVYLDGKGKTFTKEERERFETMPTEERDELIGPEETEGPTHKIKTLEATKEKIVLEYADE